jgi:hypothetical protein
MDQNEKTFKDMQLKSLTYLKNNIGIFEPIPGCLKHIERLDKNYNELDQSAKDQGTSDVSAPTSAHKSLLNSTGLKFYRLKCRLYLFATESKNVELQNSTNAPESSFTNGEQADLKLRFDKMLKLGRQYQSQLAPYLIDGEYLDSLEALLDELKKYPTVISTVSDNHKAATRSIKALNSEAREIFDCLDTAIDGYLEDEGIAEGYYEARKIKGRRNYTKGSNDNGSGTEGTNT